MVAEAPALQAALHADQCFVAGRGGRLVRAAGKASAVSGVFTSVAELKAAIHQSIEAHNAVNNAKPGAIKNKLN